MNDVLWSIKIGNWEFGIDKSFSHWCWTNGYVYDIYKHIDAEIKDFYETENSKLKAENMQMHKILREHNNLPWYKRFTKINIINDLI